MNYVEPKDRNQLRLMTSIEDYVPLDNPVRIIDLLVEQIVKNNPGKFNIERDNNYGRPRYRAETFLKLYLYGYLNSIKSSRKLEVESYRNIELMWLLGELHPDHWVISNYRKEHGELIKLLNKEFRKFLYKNEYIGGKVVLIDGTKIKANTSKEMLTIEKIKKRIAGLGNKIEKYVEEIAQNDTYEDAEEIVDKYNLEERGKLDLLTKIGELQEKIEKLEQEKKYLEKSGKKTVSPTDRDAVLFIIKE